MSSEERTEAQKSSVREPPSPAKHKRLEAMLGHALKRAAGDRPDYDYANTLLTGCVLGDPSNINYAKTHLENLQKKYDNNRTGASLGQIKGMGARNALKKAISREDCDEIIENALKVLEINPWDVTALTALAITTKKLGLQDTDPTRRTGFFDVEFFYIQAALRGSPEDPSINRLCAKALEERSNIEQAIVYWHRVEKFDPKDEEAKRSIAVLQTKRMRRQEGLDVEDTAPKRTTPGAPEPEVTLTAEQQLVKRVKEEPNQLSHYLDLAQFCIHAERFAEAEKILAQAYKRFDHDPEVREKLLDAQIRQLRQSIARTTDPEKKQKLREAYYRKELELWQNRCQRFPGNSAYRYKMGYCYFLNKEYTEAIRELQSARHDPTHKGACLLALGMCFERIKQHRLAINHYQEAIAEIPDRDADNKKMALYAAGRLALAINEIDTAEKHLTKLAGMDFAYKDVPTLLDKIAEFRQNQQLEENSKPPEGEPPHSEDEDSEADAS